MSFASSIILSVQGQANVTAIRFFSASLLDLGEFPRKSEALPSNYDSGWLLPQPYLARGPVAFHVIIKK
jgi:hypothetical protein